MMPDEPTRAKGIGSWTPPRSSSHFRRYPPPRSSPPTSDTGRLRSSLAHLAPASYLGFHFSGSLRYSSTHRCCPRGEPLCFPSGKSGVKGWLLSVLCILPLGTGAVLIERS